MSSLWYSMHLMPCTWKHRLYRLSMLLVPIPCRWKHRLYRLFILIFSTGCVVRGRGLHEHVEASITHQEHGEESRCGRIRTTRLWRRNSRADQVSFTMAHGGNLDQCMENRAKYPNMMHACRLFCRYLHEIYVFSVCSMVCAHVPILFALRVCC